MICEKEVWKDIVGFEGLYKVSNLGRVYSVPRDIPWRGRLSPCRWGGKYLKTLCRGYMIARLRKNGKTYTFRIHRLVAIAFIPNPDNKPIINHIDCDTTNNKVSNLEWCNHSENTRHAFANGLMKPSPGDKNGNSKLTTKQILKIRSLKGKLNTIEIAKMFNISQGHASHILIKRTWKHI
jgi:hypothetical protein